MKNRSGEVELKQKLRSRKWRLSNLYYITDKEGKKVRFEPNWAQLDFLENCHNLNLILKVRQLGFTTLSCIIALDLALFNSNIRAGIICHSLDDANKIFRDKVKFAYDNLPGFIKKARKASTDRAGELVFNNNSSINVSTSFRGGTLQFLHISEFGKICARYPDKAKEIVTGALNALATGQTVCIESTAEGRSGYFFDYCERSQEHQRLGKPLTKMDYKFFFYTWWKHPQYRLDNSDHIDIDDKMEEYFHQLEAEHGITLDHAQKVWYMKKREDNKDEMLREYPSTPDEAFEQVIEGAYYGQPMADAEKQGRVTLVPYEPNLPVHTAWDLGLDDATAIWFFQVEHTGAYRILRYYENSGEDLRFYVDRLHEFGYTYGTHYLPHDVEVRSIETKNSRRDSLESHGMKNIETIPSYPGALADGIHAVRQTIPKCYFDEKHTKEGRKHLKNYRKAWDERNGCFKDKPAHDESSHGSDAFRMLSLANVRTGKRYAPRKASNKYRKGR